MASFWGGRGAEPEDDFVEYDPTPYGGEYDIALTFGRPLSPSDEICHPISSVDGGDIGYDRSHYFSGSTTSAYETEADFGDRYGRPGLPQPAYGFHSQQEEEGGGGYGGDRWPQPPRPDYRYGGGEAEYGFGQGFGYGWRQEVEPHYGWQLQEEHGCGYGKDRPKPYVEEGSQDSKCTIMMYGPTGSGKSHTMFGCSKQPGIVYRALRDILGEGDGDRENDVDDGGFGLGVFVQVAVLEIYNEEIYDLLSGHSNGGGATIGLPKGNTPKIGMKAEWRAHHGHLVLFLGNKNTSPLASVQALILSPTHLKIEISLVPETIPLIAQVQCLLDVINLRASRDVAVLDFSYKFGSAKISVKLWLPAILNKFL